MNAVRSWPRLVLMILMLGLAGATAACEETLEGLGQDARENSDAITDATR